jgi:hypothetical protein
LIHPVLAALCAAAAAGRTVFCCTMAQAFRHWPMFDLRPVHVGIVVYKIAFFFDFSFSPLSINAVYSFICHQHCTILAVDRIVKQKLLLSS